MNDKPAIGEPCNGCGLCCRIRVCGAGSHALGLVERYGERVDGPCPALMPDGNGWACGLVKRPKDYIDSPRGVTMLRDAVKILIGAGAGCDEADDEPDETAAPKLRKLQEDYLERHGLEVIQKAAAIVYGKK